MQQEVREPVQPKMNAVLDDLEVQESALAKISGQLPELDSALLKRMRESVKNSDIIWSEKEVDFLTGLLIDGKYRRNNLSVAQVDWIKDCARTFCRHEAKSELTSAIYAGTSTETKEGSPTRSHRSAYERAFLLKATKDILSTTAGTIDDVLSGLQALTKGSEYFDPVSKRTKILSKPVTRKDATAFRYELDKQKPQEAAEAPKAGAAGPLPVVFSAEEKLLLTTMVSSYDKASTEVKMNLMTKLLAL